MSSLRYLLFGVIASVFGASLSWSQEAAPYDVVLFEENLMIPMRDGVRLATDIYRPARNGGVVEEPLPIVLTRTPYDKSNSEQARWFASQGYVSVVQDTRGRFKSEGEFTKYNDYDAPDGYDTIEYLASLPYTLPMVGMYGTSYGAHTQADAAKMNPPSLKTIVVNMGGLHDAWGEKVRSGGAFELGQQLGWAFDNLRSETDDGVVREMLSIENVTDWYDVWPLRKGLNPLSVAPNFEQYVFEQFMLGDYEHFKGIGENWKEYFDQTADIPMLHASGWYDSYAGGTIENFLGLSARKSSPMRLLMGPWNHGGNARSYAGDVEFGEEAAIRDWGREFHLRWFDHYLKGRSNGVENMPRIRLFVMGTGDGHKTPEGRLYHGGYWRDETEWPIPGTQFTRFYFHGDGTLSTEPPSGQGPASTTYSFDPRDPVPTIGGAFSGTLRNGPYDQREREDFIGSKPPSLPLKARRDVVVFQTEPLEEDVEVVGPIEIHLFASSNALDTDFTVKLVDVYPPSEDFPTGFEMNLTDGIIRARYRNSPDREELMTPGEVYEFVIRPFPTGNVFKRGHRIRVDISSSNFPRFDVNPNTGEPLGADRRFFIADNTIHHSPDAASHIVLPIVPTKRLPGDGPGDND